MWSHCGTFLVHLVSCGKVMGSNMRLLESEFFSQRENSALQFAYVTSTVSSLLTTFNTQNMRTQEHQRNIDGFCRTHCIPKALARKLSGFYDYVLPLQIHSQDKEIISGLPESLQQQVRSPSPCWP